MKCFQDRVYRIVAGIPSGYVMTYGEVACRAGSPGAARVVGNFMAKNQNWPKVPCHRVIAAGGRVGAWSGKGGRPKKISLLRREGHCIKQGILVRFRRV